MHTQVVSEVPDDLGFQQLAISNESTSRKSKLDSHVKDGRALHKRSLVSNVLRLMAKACTALISAGL